MLQVEFMRPFSILLLLAVHVSAEHTLYVCGSISRGFVVGRRLEPSGLYIRRDPGPAGGFRHAGFTHPSIMTVGASPADPGVLYAAAGNGIIRMTASGEQWRILTDWRHTEFQDLAVAPHAPHAIYAAATDGVIASHDGGATWMEASNGLRRRFIGTVAVDRSSPGTLFAGGEDGIYRSTDSARSWSPIVSSARMVNDLAQSPHDPSVWMAATQDHGILLSRDSGRTWTALAAIPQLGVTWNNIDFSPQSASTVAAAAFGKGVWLSEDLGASWQDRSARLPTRQVWRARFDPDSRDSLYVSVHEEALFVSTGNGRSEWRRAGLEGSLANDLVFLPAPAKGGR